MDRLLHILLKLLNWMSFLVCLAITIFFLYGLAFESAHGGAGYLGWWCYLGISTLFSMLTVVLGYVLFKQTVANLFGVSAILLGGLSAFGSVIKANHAGQIAGGDGGYLKSAALGLAACSLILICPGIYYLRLGLHGRLAATDFSVDEKGTQLDP